LIHDWTVDFEHCTCGNVGVVYQLGSEVAAVKRPKVSTGNICPATIFSSNERQPCSTQGFEIEILSMSILIHHVKNSGDCFVVFANILSPFGPLSASLGRSVFDGKLSSIANCFYGRTNHRSEKIPSHVLIQSKDPPFLFPRRCDLVKR
jgi:hypothetical protein